MGGNSNQKPTTSQRRNEGRGAPFGRHYCKAGCPRLASVLWTPTWVQVSGKPGTETRGQTERFPMFSARWERNRGTSRLPRFFSVPGFSVNVLPLVIPTPSAAEAGGICFREPEHQRCAHARHPTQSQRTRLNEAPGSPAAWVYGVMVKVSFADGPPPHGPLRFVPPGVLTTHTSALPACRIFAAGTVTWISFPLVVLPKR